MATINKMPFVFLLLNLIISYFFVAAVPLAGQTDELADGVKVRISQRPRSEKYLLVVGPRTTPVTHSKSFGLLLHVLLIDLLLQHILER